VPATDLKSLTGYVGCCSSLHLPLGFWCFSSTRVIEGGTKTVNYSWRL